MTQVEKIKAYLERRIAEIHDISQGYIANKQTSTEYLLLYELLSFIDSLSDTEKDFGIKESVIPFGASDSELMEATYFIPQGCHAVIDDNKVIIKKGEEPISNDLEKAAIEAFKQIVDSDKNSFLEIFKAGAQWRKEQMIEWLKENKDHPFIECEDPCLSGYLTDEFIEDFKKVMEE